MINNPWRKDFPQINKGNIYFDTAATSLKPFSVIDAVEDYNRNLSANIHRGMYATAVKTTELYENTREIVAKFINAEVDEIIYTRGTTTGLNMVASVYGLANINAGDEIIVSELEHHSSFLPWQNVAKKTGAILKYVPLNEEGRITVEAFKSVLNKNTKIVALTYVSNVMGYITPIKEIIELAHQYEAIVIVDAAQAIQHLKIDVKELDCDFLAFSGHKMLGPTGVGILFGKQEIISKCEPFEYGGDMNEDVGKDFSTWKTGPQKFEAGTMPIAEIIGLAEAIKYIEKIGLKKIHEHVTKIHRYALAQIKQIPGVKIYNETADTGIISFNLDNVPSHDAITFFAEKGVSLRAGQHCAKLICDWLGIYSCLRASLYIYNTYKDIDVLIITIKEAVEYFKQLGF